jgi:hypothetical protein
MPLVAALVILMTCVVPGLLVLTIVPKISIGVIAVVITHILMGINPPIVLIFGQVDAVVMEMLH